MAYGSWEKKKRLAKYGCVPGNFKIKDYNNDGKLTDDDYIIDGQENTGLDRRYDKYVQNL